MTMPDAHDEYEYNVLEISPKIPSLQVLNSHHMEFRGQVTSRALH